MKIRELWSAMKALMFIRKMAVEAKREVKTMDNEVKPGWKTTEFWITAIAAGLTMIQSMQGSIPHPWGEIVIAIMAAAYSIARTIAKKPTP